MKAKFSLKKSKIPNQTHKKIYKIQILIKVKALKNLEENKTILHLKVNIKLNKTKNTNN